MNQSESEVYFFDIVKMEMKETARKSFNLAINACLEILSLPDMTAEELIKHVESLKMTDRDLQ